MVIIVLHVNIEILVFSCLSNSVRVRNKRHIVAREGGAADDGDGNIVYLGEDNIEVNVAPGHGERIVFPDIISIAVRCFVIGFFFQLIAFVGRLAEYSYRIAFLCEDGRPPYASFVIYLYLGSAVRVGGVYQMIAVRGICCNDRLYADVSARHGEYID